MFRVKEFVVVFGLSIGAGCTPHDLANRYGVSPIPTQEEFKSASDIQSGVIEALAEATYPDGRQMPVTPEQWYEVTLTGYTAVDQACDDYLRTIFKFEREKGRFDATMLFADKATGAILSASKVAPATVQIVSQGFGLGSNFGAAVADSYLFKVRPSAVAGLVAKLRTKYRSTIEAAMIDPRKTNAERPIRSAATAFQSIYGYRQICYPETLEAQIEEMMGASKAKNEEETGAAKPKTGNTGDPPGAGKTVPTAAPRIILSTR